MSDKFFGVGPFGQPHDIPSELHVGDEASNRKIELRVARGLSHRGVRAALNDLLAHFADEGVVR